MSSLRSKRLFVDLALEMLIELAVAVTVLFDLHPSLALAAQEAALLRSMLSCPGECVQSHHQSRPRLLPSLVVPMETAP